MGCKPGMGFSMFIWGLNVKVFAIHLLKNEKFKLFFDQKRLDFIKRISCIAGAMRLSIFLAGGFLIQHKFLYLDD